MSISSRNPWALAASAFLILSGCATQEAVTEQTDSIRSQVARLDTSLQTLSESARQAQEQLGAALAREKALGARVDGLTAEAKALKDRLAEQGQRIQATDANLRESARQLGERALHAELRLDEAATLASGVTAQTEANASQLAATLDLTATIADRLAAQGKRVDQLAARMQAATEEANALRKEIEAATAGVRAQDQRVQGLLSRFEQTAAQASGTAEQAATLRKEIDAAAAAGQARDGALKRMEQRADQLAAQVTGGADQVTAMRRDLDAGSVQSKSLTQRQAQAEQRLERLDSAMPERIGRLETRLEDLNRLTRSVIEMAAQNEIRSNGKVAFSTVLTEDKTLYPLNLQTLAPKDRAALDDLVKRLKALGKDYHLEIQGHTDNIGVDDYNYLLGKARAEVVKRYLHDQGGIPLSWMSVISYGATQPLDPKSNTNRRILIQTLVLDSEK